MVALCVWGLCYSKKKECNGVFQFAFLFQIVENFYQPAYCFNALFFETSKEGSGKKSFLGSSYIKLL